MGADPQDQRAQPLSAELGRAEPVRAWAPARSRRTPATTRPARSAALAYLGGRGDPQPISQESGAAGRCVSAPPSRLRLAGAAVAARARRAGAAPANPIRRISARSSAAAISRPRPTAPAATRVPGSGKPFAGGRADRNAVRHHRLAEHHARPRNRHRRLERRRSSTRAVRKGIRPDGSRLYPAMPYTVLHQDVARRRAGDPRLSQHGRAGAQRGRSPTRCRSRSTSAPRCGSGTRCTSRAGEFKPDPQQVRRNGIAAPSWSRARRIAAPATRRRRCSAATRPASTCRARICRAGSRRTSPTTTRRGLGGWSADDVVDLSEDRPQPHQRRHRPDGGGGRAVEFAHDRQRSAGHRDLSEDRCRAGTTAPPPLPANDPAMVAGAAIYRDQCSACHGIDGKGVAEAVPVARAVLDGALATIRPR